MDSEFMGSISNVGLRRVGSFFKTSEKHVPLTCGKWELW